MTTEQYSTGVAPLRNVTALVTLIEEVQARAPGLPGMACFYGRSGDGKSTAAAYAANRFNAVYVQIKSVWSPSMIVEAILEETGQRKASGDRIGHMANKVSAALALEQVPLIVDEADYLVKRRLIEIMRDIYESAQTPVILIGEEGLPQKLQQWERVHGRMYGWIGAEPGNLTDVKHLTPIYARGVDVSEDLQRAILEACNGSIRRISTNLARIATFARTRGMKRIGGEEWGDRAFDTGMAPAPRRAVA